MLKIVMLSCRIKLIFNEKFLLKKESIWNIILNFTTKNTQLKERNNHESYKLLLTKFSLKKINI